MKLHTHIHPRSLPQQNAHNNLLRRLQTMGTQIIEYLTKPGKYQGSERRKTESESESQNDKTIKNEKKCK